MEPAAAAPAPEAVARYFRDVLEAFECATAQTGRTSHHVALAGSTVSIDFAGTAAEQLFLPALAHAPGPVAAAPSLRVAAWDSASSGVALPDPPWPRDTLVCRGEVSGFAATGAVRAAYQPGSGVLMLYDVAAGEAVAWVADAGCCPYWEFAAPLRGLWHWWCEGRGMQLVHGAAVGGSDAAVLLTGKGGSGKSSTALAALLADMSYLGDDYVVVEPGSPPRLHSLYASAKVDESALERMPRLRSLVAVPPASAQDKAVLFAPRRVPGALPLCAIVVPRIAADGARLSPLSPAAAFLALAPTTVFQLPGAGRGSTAILRELVSAVPCFELVLGPEPLEAVQLLRGLVSRS